MTVEEIKDLIKEKLSDMEELQRGLARDEVPLSGWSFGYITALNQVLEDIKEQENAS